MGQEKKGKIAVYRKTGVVYTDKLFLCYARRVIIMEERALVSFYSGETFRPEISRVEFSIEGGFPTLPFTIPSSTISQLTYASEKLTFAFSRKKKKEKVTSTSGLKFKCRGRWRKIWGICSGEGEWGC